MTTEEMTLVKVLTDPTAYWVAEHAKITEAKNFRADKIKGNGRRVSGPCVQALLEDALTPGT